MNQNDKGQEVVADILFKLKEREATAAAQNRCVSPTNTDPYSNTPPTAYSNDEDLGAQEVYRLKRELDVAKERMALMHLQLDQSRSAQHTMNLALGSPYPNASQLAANIPGHSVLSASNSFPQVTDYSRAPTPFERGSFNGQSQS